MNLLKNIYLTRWFFFLLVAIIVLYIVAFSVPSVDFIATVALASLAALTIVDVLLVFSAKNPLLVKRDAPTRLNLGDASNIRLIVENNAGQPVTFTLIEGYPVEMQNRSGQFKATLLNGKQKEFSYSFTPKKRGQYHFSDVFILMRSLFRLVSRRIIIPLEQEFAVYPSVLQMKKHELMVFKQQKASSGIKKIRRLGNNSEFEQIKNYVQGDEIRTINWKATSRRNELMINQYQEEKSQSIYCIIDKSRSMQMEAEGLTMLDYSINSSLVFSNIALRKGDKAGIITYSDKIGSLLPADRAAGQMRKIQDLLYSQKTMYKEGNFELLYQTIRQTIRSRSLLVLFTNFETEFAMRRSLTMLRRLNKKHVLVVVFFENLDLHKIAYEPAHTIMDVYQSTVAEKMISHKSKMAQELRKNGIQTILTLPEELSINTINKYLELKAKGTI